MDKILNGSQLNGDAFSVQGGEFGVLFLSGTSSGGLKLQVQNPEDSEEWIDTGLNLNADGLKDKRLSPSAVYRVGGLTAAGATAFVVTYNYRPTPKKLDI